MTVIRAPKIETCTACDRRFDLNFWPRMQRQQKRHARQQIHMFGPCDFLLRDFTPHYLIADLYDTPWDDEPRRSFFTTKTASTATRAQEASTTPTEMLRDGTSGKRPAEVGL